MFTPRMKPEDTLILEAARWFAETYPAYVPLLNFAFLGRNSLTPKVRKLYCKLLSDAENSTLLDGNYRFF